MGVVGCEAAGGAALGDPGFSAPNLHHRRSKPGNTGQAQTLTRHPWICRHSSASPHTKNTSLSHDMARKSQRLSAASQASPAHKRAASNSDTTSASSKRTKQGVGPKETPKKSQYFQSDRGDGDGDDDDDEEEATSADEEGSDFDEDEEESPPSDSDEHDEFESDDDKPKRSNRSTPKKGATTSAAIRAKGQEVWRPGVKTGLGPGNQVVIKKPKARAAGKTPYEDETIHPNTLLFLADLKENNDRQWLKSTFVFLSLRGSLSSAQVVTMPPSRDMEHPATASIIRHLGAILCASDMLSFALHLDLCKRERLGCRATQHAYHSGDLNLGCLTAQLALDQSRHASEPASANTSMAGLRYSCCREASG